MKKDDQNELSSDQKYEIALDEQTDRFLSLRHQLTYFLVTAAVVPLGFTMKFAAEYEGDFPFSRWSVFSLVVGGIVGLLSAWFALSALRHDISSHRRHIEVRHRRTSYDRLLPDERAKWDKDNKLAADSRDWTFRFIVISIAAQALFFGLIFVSKGG